MVQPSLMRWLFVVLLVACGGVPSPRPDAGPADAAVEQLMVDAGFVAAMARKGNQLDVTVRTLEGVVATDAQVSVALFMPAHGHGAPAPTVTDSGSGRFQAQVNFTMAGTWRVTVQATAGGMTGSRALTVSVP